MKVYIKIIIVTKLLTLLSFPNTSIPFFLNYCFQFRVSLSLVPILFCFAQSVIFAIRYLFFPLPYSKLLSFCTMKGGMPLFQICLIIYLIPSFCL